MQFSFTTLRGGRGRLRTLWQAVLRRVCCWLTEEASWPRLLPRLRPSHASSGGELWPEGSLKVRSADQPKRDYRNRLAAGRQGLSPSYGPAVPARAGRAGQTARLLQQSVEFRFVRLGLKAARRQQGDVRGSYPTSPRAFQHRPTKHRGAGSGSGPASWRPEREDGWSFLRELSGSERSRGWLSPPAHEGTRSKGQSSASSCALAPCALVFECGGRSGGGVHGPGHVLPGACSL